MSEALRFEILGPQRAWYADRPLDLGAGKQRAVLAVLLLSAGRPVSTGQLVEAVWPEEPPANGPNVVQKHVAGLRRVLEPDRSPRTPGRVLTLTDAGYLLRIPPESVDAARFERGVQRARQQHAAGRTAEALAELTAALDLWQGEPFTGFPGPYFDTARHRLVELRAVALETRVELALESGRHRELVGELVELVAEFPVRERLRHQLMLALYRSGRQAEALAAYREFAGLLREEYGIEPGEVLQELHGRMLRSDATLLPARTAPASAPAVPAQSARPVETVAVATAAAPVAPGSPATPAAPVAFEDPATPAAPGAFENPAPPAAPVAFENRTEAEPVAVAGPVGPAQPVPASPPDWGAGPVPPPAGWLPPGTATGPAQVWPAGPPLGPVPMPAVPRGGVPPWLSIGTTVVAVLTALGSFGFLTWLVVLLYAVWRRSWRNGLAAAYYLTTAATCLSTVGTSETEDVTDFEAFLITIWLITWLAGAVHVVLLNGRLLGWFRARWRRRPTTEDRRLRREHARYLLYHYPTARGELHIGRPDLPRAYDDGGLVDINAVADQVLLGLPGLSPTQAQHLMLDRRVRGAYASMEELAARCLLPPAVSEPLREVLLFLPPPSAYRPS
ncbi:winged helix-turn-helix domain-containing protein [Micromonospora sp. DR5-3]|uniref:BTAD domain-containing putative transcriptional regulator n=1 Tax=unclassified Micromonospora TaxID=2617518 RepID=UPI0011D504C0|nr:MULTISPECIES: BTAD domain-containing putative transcriptional regulator [unclassified Micromonospora]MCW3812854.1 winged helix-turn-helix domain-containing protein [Micromonospora sp. DR5-3]TYC26136.1 transcriptional regulator [Micromonospora sp. MP36]